MYLCLQIREGSSWFVYIAEYTTFRETFLYENIYSSHTADYKTEFGLAIKIYSVRIFMVNESILRLLKGFYHKERILCNQNAILNLEEHADLLVSCWKLILWAISSCKNKF